MATPLARVLRFGTFELDVQNGELRKSGLAVRIQEQPRQVLLALLERPGQVVAREELCRRLWADGTFVDFEHSLNTAVKKLRDALGDAAENPRFIETVPLRGYRFMAPLDAAGGEDPPQAAPPPPSPRPWKVVAALALVLAAAVVALLRWMSEPPRLPKLVGSTQLTYSGRVIGPELTREVFHPLLTDGTRIYFGEYKNAIVTSQILATGGEIQPLPLPFRQQDVLHLSPDGSQLLLCERQEVLDREGPLWIVPALGGAPWRLGDVTAHGGAWSPDGRRVVYARGEGVFVVNADGTGSRQVASVPGRAAWLRWSPDGRRLRFTVVNAQTHGRSLWEVLAGGEGLRPMFSQEGGGGACCGEWTPDGRHFVFSRWERDDRPDLWLLREGSALHSSRPPERLTAGPLHFLSPLPSRDGRRLFAVGVQPRGEKLKFDLRSREFTRVEANEAGTFSRDKAWVAYTEGRGKEINLWRSRVDGSERLQLTTPPMRVFNFEWSPDGNRIAFMGKRAGEAWKVYLIGADGGAPQPLLDWDRNEADPSWSADGRSLILGHPPDYMAERGLTKAIRIVDLRTRRLMTLPGSEGLFSPRWSPDGRYVAAMPLDQSTIMLFDFTSRTWSELVPGRERERERSMKWGPNLPFWSHDGRLLYFQNFQEHGGPLYRVRMSDRTIERIVDLGEIKRSIVVCWFRGLALDGSPLASCSVSTADIYALDWDVP